MRAPALRLSLSIGLFIAVLPALQAETDSTTAAQAQARAQTIAQTFGKNLKAELQAGLQAGGPVAAIAVCHDQAPAIAAKLAAQYDASVGRTSLRPRNPDNAPDAWEQQVLNNFAEQRANGAPASTLRASTVTGDGQYRYMQAIGTQPLCLNCHGSVLADPVADKLDALYPHDQARGYAVGDIRGAFTIALPLSQINAENPAQQ